MTSTLDDARGELLALADRIDLCAPVTPEGRAAIMLNKSEWTTICTALRAAPVPQCDAVNARVRVAEYICHRFICANDECDGCQPSSVSLEHADTILRLVSPPSEAGREMVHRTSDAPEQRSGHPSAENDAP